MIWCAVWLMHGRIFEQVILHNRTGAAAQSRRLFNTLQRTGDADLRF